MLRAAAAHGLTVVPRGAAPSCPGARRRQRRRARSTSARSTRSLDHAAGDLIVVTQAGRRSPTCRRSSAGAGQRLALDETVPGASVGGMLATNASGRAPRRHRHGARPADRRHPGPRRRRRRQGRRPGRQERRRLRPGQAADRLVRHARRGHRRHFRLHPVPGRHRWVRSVADPAAGPGRWRRRCCTRRPCRPRSRSTGPRPGGGAVHVLLEGREDGVDGRAATVARRCSAAPRPSPRTPRPAGRRTPGTPRPPATTAPPRSSSPSRSPGSPTCSPRRARSALHVRGSAGAGVAYAALAGRHPVDAAAAAVAAAARDLHARRRQRRRRGRPRRGQGRRRRVGTGARAGPDAPGQGPVRPRPPARAGTLRGRHLMTDQRARRRGGSARPAASSTSAMPAPGRRLRRAPPAGRRAHRRLRALRLLPADLPDVRAVGRGDGLARAGAST